MQKFRTRATLWLILATVITVLCGLVYLAIQQAYRQLANDPQVQVAEDAARALSAGQPAEGILPANSVDLAQSLSLYVIIFDRAGSPLASNATLHGKIPQLPGGVLDSARQKGENRITWQPEPGVRSAVVIVPVSGGTAGFVLAGRSLRESEQRTAQISRLVGLAWLVMLGATLALTLLFPTMNP